MKKRIRLSALFFLLLSALVLTAVAAGGDASDPLVSLSHLTQVFSGKVDARVEEKLDASDQSLLDAASAKLSGTAAAETTASSWTELRVKSGDVLSGSAGLNVLVLAGSVKVTFASGAVVDVTAGTTVPSGTALTARHRCITAENTSAAFTAVSKTAVLSYMGPYALALSSAPDYNAMAGALKTMHLFRGSFTGYGSGYDLELAPTRLQALIMFLRVLGEEDEALAFSGSAPFSDLAAGSDAAKYVGYAYEKGYTNGYTATAWAPARTVNVYQYTEFVLRALGYSSTANTDLSGTLDRSVDCGVLTSGEISSLKAAPFLRADLVYISYYALDASAAEGGTLRSILISKGVFTAAEASAAKSLVKGNRIG
ncbi:MAG: S-layer homology domain-containing protein [Oscillibacter sp.]|jgi:hypothetical protein|nr:S-layer homology domain-containing protein [Oscillibacter sp.]